MNDSRNRRKLLRVGVVGTAVAPENRACVWVYRHSISVYQYYRYLLRPVPSRCIVQNLFPHNFISAAVPLFVLTFVLDRINNLSAAVLTA